jgi:glucokinase
MKLLGLDIGGTNIRAGLVEDNNLVRAESVRVKKNGSSDEIMEDVLSLIRKFDLNGITGIGAGVPSVVDVEKGIVYDVMNIPSWKEVHMKEIFESEFKIPVHINNDANCFACGEKYFGKARQYSNIVGLITGTGFGAGIILNNKLYAGNNCGAGEFGMVKYKDKDYESYCSGQFFTGMYKVPGEELSRRAAENDTEALRIYEEYGRSLGDAVTMILYTIDPEIIILGGSVSRSFQYYKKAMFSTLQGCVYPGSVEKLKIEVSELQYGAILGAAALCYDAS